MSNSSVEGGREAGAAAAGGSTPLNPLLTRPLAPGESIVWYLGHLGWAVRTAKHFLIFDYDGRLTRPPDEPSLASGWIVPAEIRDLPTTVFVTHDHDDHYAPAVFDWKATVKDLTVVTGFEPEGKAGYVYIPPRESRRVGDLEITTIKAMDAGVGFHVRVDGISIFHSGDHDAAWEMPTFKPEIDFLADRGLRADLLFMPVQAGDIPILKDGLGYAVGRLSAGAFFPGHGRGREHVYLAVAEALRKAGVTTPIHCAEFGGDHFEARTSRQGPKRMSSMTEADWDASDRDRDGRYELDAALDSVGIAPGMTVGEVGAGAGYLVFKLAARVGPSGKVFAEDIKAYVLEILKTRARRRGLVNVETLVGTADDPLLPAATFDAIFMHATIQFIDKPVVVFNALVPALKPGGRIVLIEQPRPEHLETFRQAGLKVERLDETIASPFALYVLSPAGESRVRGGHVSGRQAVGGQV